MEMVAAECLHIVPLVIFSLSLLSTFPPVQADADKRCRCVCPRLKTISSLNSTHLLIDHVDYADQTVYIRNNVEPESCVCIEILNYILPDLTVDNIEDLDKFCLRCECQFEQRNSTIQKVVIIFVIVVFGLMLIYGLFLMCLDPIMNKRRTHFRQFTDEQSEELTGEQPRLRSGSRTEASRRVAAAVNHVRATQEKWKGQLNTQRQNIYQKHNILA
ncbi:hypothetical protein EB796_024868 [Bugula neritina]|uniref:TMEM9 n=1 Tax=Bugula neritina TaxID=10212 RepID=A0A7J7IUB3_BUGNE|nr:hypothetical protein EB796_024868 [Bugula neritina]